MSNSKTYKFKDETFKTLTIPFFYVPFKSRPVIPFTLQIHAYLQYLN